MLEKAFKEKKREDIFQCFSVPRSGCNFLMLLNNCNNTINFAFFKQSENVLREEKVSHPATTEVQQCQF